MHYKCSIFSPFLCLYSTVSRCTSNGINYVEVLLYRGYALFNVPYDHALTCESNLKNILIIRPKILDNAWETDHYVPTTRYVKKQCFMSAQQRTNDELVSEWKHDMTSA